MAVIVNGDGILTGVSSLTTALDDLTSGRGTVTGVATVGTLQLGAGVSISSPRTQTAAIFTNNTEFLTVDDAGRVGVGTITPDSDAHPENNKKINVGFITAKSIAGDIDARNVVVAGISTFSGDVSIADKIIHTGDTDTAIRFNNDNVISFETAGADRFALGTNEVVVNDPGNDVDFRIEGDSNANLVKVDAGNDRVGVGLAAPQQVFHVYHASDNGLALFESGDAQCRIDLKDNSGQVSIQAVGDALLLNTSSSNTERLRIISTGEVGINMTPSNGQMLAITGRSGYDDMVQMTAVGTNIGARINLTNTGTGVARINATNNSLQLQTGGTSALTIDTSQRVILGTTSESNTGTVLTVYRSQVDNNSTVDEQFKNSPLKIVKTISAVNLRGGIIDGWDGNIHGIGIAMRYDGSRYHMGFGVNNDTNDRPTEKMSISGNGDVTINDGNLIIGTSGHGISFAATGDSSGTMENELLDDYEEGRFTGIVQGGGDSVTYSIQRGAYTKIGDVVYFQLDMYHAGTGNSNTLRIGGLPFTSKNQATYAFGGAFLNYSNGAFGTIPAVFHIPSQNTYMQVYNQETGNVVLGNTSGVNIFSNKEYVLTGIYKAS